MSVCRVMALWGLWWVLLALPVQVSSSAVEGCRVQCGQTLAQCNQTQAASGQCPKRHAQCLQRCEGSLPKDLRSPIEKKQALCEQRCDLNRSSCEDANPNNGDSCRAGRQSCVQRCQSR